MPLGILRAKRMRGGSEGLRGSLGQVLPRGGGVWGRLGAGIFPKRCRFSLCFYDLIYSLGQIGQVNYTLNLKILGKQGIHRSDYRALLPQLPRSVTRP